MLFGGAQGPGLRLNVCLTPEPSMRQKWGAAGDGAASAALAVADDAVGELPILHPVHVDRPLRERHQHRRDPEADRAAEQPQEDGQRHQPALVDGEGDQPERADQPLGLLAELPPSFKISGPR